MVLLPDEEGAAAMTRFKSAQMIVRWFREWEGHPVAFGFVVGIAIALSRLALRGLL